MTTVRPYISAVAAMRQRDVLLLRLVEGFSVAETARRMQCAEGTVKAAIRQVVEACTAGATGLIAVAAHDVSIEDPASAVVAFALGAILMTAGSAAARWLPTIPGRRAPVRDET